MRVFVWFVKIKKTAAILLIIALRQSILFLYNIFYQEEVSSHGDIKQYEINIVECKWNKSCNGKRIFGFCRRQ